MDNFTIYRNGKYATVDNLKLKIKPAARGMMMKVDDFFVNH